MGDGQHSNNGGSLDGMSQDNFSNDGSMPDMSSAWEDDDDDKITPSAFPSVAVDAFAPQDDDGAPEEKSGEPISGGIPTDAPTPILKDVSGPSPDGGSESSSMSRSQGSSKLSRD